MSFAYRTPYIAVLISSLFGAAAYLSVQYHSLQVLLWLLNLSTVAGLVSWVVLCVAYLRMHAGMKAQGYSRDGMLMLLSVYNIGRIETDALLSYAYFFRAAL